MQQTCHRCGGDLPEGSGESPFCPHCGAPQLFLALENQSVETGGEVASAPAASAAAAPRPQAVDWKTAIRCAAAVAAVGSVLAVVAIRVDILSPLSLLWIMSASLITLGFYQKRKPAAWMNVRIGARIGVVVGVCLALELGFAMAGVELVARYVLHSMGSFDAALTALIQQSQQQAGHWMASQSIPMTAETKAFERTPEFRAGLVLFYYAAGSLILLAISTLGGAFAGLLRMRRGKAA